MDRHEHEIQSEEYQVFLNDPGWHRAQAEYLRKEAAKHDREAELLEARRASMRKASNA